MFSLGFSLVKVRELREPAPWSSSAANAYPVEKSAVKPVPLGNIPKGGACPGLIVYVSLSYFTFYFSSLAHSTSVCTRT